MAKNLDLNLPCLDDEDEPMMDADPKTKVVDEETGVSLLTL